MNIDWTTVISSGVVAGIICIFNTISSRYTVRLLDHVERLLKAEKRNEDNK
jgi:hypothetical protein